MNPEVNWFFEKRTPWQAEYAALRKLALSTGLTEELKWGCPCYTHEGANVVLIHGFKGYCALLFMKGALLKNEKLIQQTKNVQSARQLRFTSLGEINEQAKSITATIREAIALEKSGAKVKLKTTAEAEMPAEFKKALKANAQLKTAFNQLTPGRQRGYLLHFSQAKQAATREARIEKHTPRILAGKGIDD